VSVLVDFSVVPIGKGEHLSAYVARCEKIVRESGLPNRLHAMGTEIEGESLREVMDVVERCVNELQTDCDRVLATIQLDARKGGRNRLTEKIASVDRKLGN